MLKRDVIEEVAARTGLTKKASGDAVEAFLGVVTDALRKGDEVLLTGFGKFMVRERAARAGINPQTMERIMLPATKVPAFKAGKGLKTAVK
jgi:DNA-binding protein HU-beta